VPRYLDDGAVARLRPAAEKMVAIVDGAEGRTREQIDEELEEIIARPSDRVVVQGLRKLLLDRCTFACPEGPDPAALRRAVFEQAARVRSELAPREAFDRDEIVARVAAEHEVTAELLEERLFADLRQNEVLTEVRNLSADALLERYDVSLAQGVLMRATRVLVALDGEEPGRVRQLFRAARFHGLLHRVTDEGEGKYLIELDGPFSLFSAVQKYGLKLAMFLPAVLRCRRWRLRADVRWGKKKEPRVFELGPEHGLVPHARRITGVAPELEKFIEGFRKLESPWSLEENDEIIAIPGEAVCVPDLRFTHRDTGEVVFLEAFGFWSRQAVWQRIEAVERGFPGRLILAVGKQLRVSEEVLSDDDAAQLYVYGASMRPKAVLKRLDNVG
jgi:predicted nuclease of restriction endonuclease-like RecB superfamily